MLKILERPRKPFRFQTLCLAFEGPLYHHIREKQKVFGFLFDDNHDDLFELGNFRAIIRQKKPGWYRDFDETVQEIKRKFIHYEGNGDTTCPFFNGKAFRKHLDTQHHNTLIYIPQFRSSNAYREFGYKIGDKLSHFYSFIHGKYHLLTLRVLSRFQSKSKQAEPGVL